MKIKISAFILISTFLFTACSSLQNNEDIKIEQVANLDYINNSIILPLNEYTLTEQDINVFTKANNLLTQQCLQEQGLQTTLVPDPAELGPRDYGMWNPDWTKSYGYGLSLLEEEEVLSEDVTKARIECAENNTDKYFTNLTKEFNLPLSLALEARLRAEQHPAWKEAKERWEGCLSEQGLTFSSSEQWATDQGTKLIEQGEYQNPKNMSEMIRIATLEAECSKKEGIAEELANIEGTYQKKLISDNLPSLNELKIKKQEKLKEAQEVISKIQ